MELVVFEDAGYRNLLPLVYSRASFNLRCGFDNLLEKIEAALGKTADAVFVRPILAEVMAERQMRAVNRAPGGDDQFWINGRLLLRGPIELSPGMAAWRGETLLAARISASDAAGLSPDVLLDGGQLRSALSKLKPGRMEEARYRLIKYPWHVIEELGAEIGRQCALRSAQRLGRVDAGAHLVNPDAIHLAAGSRVRCGAVLDAESGPIHIAESAVIGPATVITGPCFIGAGSLVRPGASISGSGIGPVCKVGGEIEGSIIHAYSNKQHDGFLGHSYVGEWVNLGADTVGSDLKNNYGNISVPINGVAVDSGLMFFGAVIGDHTKTGIGTKLPTGCVIGYACNVAKAGGFVPKFVPSFTWLTDDGMARHEAKKALATAMRVVERRGRVYSCLEEKLFSSVAGEAAGIERN